MVSDVVPLLLMGSTVSVVSQATRARIRVAKRGARKRAIRRDNLKLQAIRRLFLSPETNGWEGHISFAAGEGPTLGTA
jgi:hypothetical protein